MVEVKNCPFCDKEVGIDELWCRYCDVELNGNLNPYKSDNPADPPEGKNGEMQMHHQDDEFSELDYRPKKSSGCLVSSLVIVLVLLIISAGVFFLQSDGPDPEAEGEIEMPEPDQVIEENTNNIVGEDEYEEVLEEQETDRKREEEHEEVEIYPPDYDLLEPALTDWLIVRIGDSEIILLHSDKLDDVDFFFETYDLEEDNVLVYDNESIDDEHVTVLFGLPYSQWSLRAVFIWDGTKWLFLREAVIE